MFKKEQFIRIAEMQDSMNQLAAGVSWKSDNLDWSTAVYVEGAECLGHLGWEWWKKTTPDLDQARMEVVDMLHFAMSGLLTFNLPAHELFDKQEEALEAMLPAQLDDMNSWTAIEFLKEISLHCVVNNYGFAVYLVVRLAEVLDMGADTLYTMYVGKNLLNRFRKSHGYKEGTYVKIWNGREDNEYLTDLLNTTPVDTTDYEEFILNSLEVTYASITK